MARPTRAPTAFGFACIEGSYRRLASVSEKIGNATWRPTIWTVGRASRRFLEQRCRILW